MRIFNCLLMKQNGPKYFCSTGSETGTEHFLSQLSILLLIQNDTGHICNQKNYGH